MRNTSITFTGEILEPHQTIQGGEIVTLQSMDSFAVDVPVFVKGLDGVSIQNIEWNDDYTFTIILTDGTSYTSPNLKGIGIASVTLNPDYTLTFTLDNGESFTTASVRGPEGPPGPPGETFPEEGTPGQVLTKTLEGTSWQDVVSNPTSTFVYKQNTAADVWTIYHNLGKYPTVTIVDSASTVVYGEIDYVDLNTIIISFNCAFSGKAVLV